MRKASLALAAALCIGAATQAFAAPVAFFLDTTPVTTTGTMTFITSGNGTVPSFTSSTSSQLPLTPGTPTLTGATSMTVGQTETFNIWVNFSDPTDLLDSISLNVKSSNASVVETTAVVVPDALIVSGTHKQFRWDNGATSTGTLGGAGSSIMVTNLKGQAVTQDGLSATDPLNDGTDNSGDGLGTNNNVYFGSITIKADNPGTTSIYLGVGSGQMGYFSGDDEIGSEGTGPVILSAADLASNTQASGTGSAYATGADAVITVTAAPEPASLALLGLGGLCLLRRRSSRKA